MKAIGIIPARFASTRLPGKPLISILGKSLIQRTYENACLCKEFSEVIVATDDERIFSHVESFGGKVVMTSPDCLNGTMRIFEVVSQEKYNSFDVVVNVQGDEPCVNPGIISELILKLANEPDLAVATPVVLLKEDLDNPSIVKCVKDLKGHALYFSRSVVPYHAKNGNGTAPYFRHIGLYAYRREFLFKYASLKNTPLAEAESLEQLKILENGYSIGVIEVDYSGVDVNDPDDIKKIENYLCQQNLSS